MATDNIRIDQLQPASFRGVPFQVSAADGSGGRRTQVNEYPQRDKPYAQDLGRATRRPSFDAFVVGDDYVDKANALIGALEEFGPGTLIHPWLGSMQVSVLEDGYRYRFNQALGVCEFQLSFVESGDLVFPSSAQSTAALSRQAANTLETASVNEFAAVFEVLGTVNYMATKALSTYGQVLSFMSNPAFALGGLIGFADLPSNLTSLGALLGQSINLGWSFAGLVDLSGLASDGTLTQSDATTVPLCRGLVRMATDPALAAPAAQTYATPIAKQIAANDAAILAHSRQLLLVQAAGLSSYCACAVYDDIEALKNELVAALDAETLQTSNDDTYQALVAARSAVFADLTARSRNSARLLTITPPDVLPLLAIAYDYYEDAGRDLEIAQRNKISNPGFVPVAPIRVLSQ